MAYLIHVQIIASGKIFSLYTVPLCYCRKLLTNHFLKPIAPRMKNLAWSQFVEEEKGEEDVVVDGSGQG